MIRLRAAHVGVALGLAVGMSAGASAATATANLLVTTNVLSACAVTALPLSFGDYDPTATTPAEATTSITVLCTAGTAYTVGLGQGQHGSSVTTRQMLGATTASLLNYALYRDAGRTQNWGTAAGTVEAGTAGALPALFTVYGRVPAGQNVGTDIYSDTVLVTVNY